MDEQTYLAYSQTEEGHAFLDAYITNEGVDSNSALMIVDKDVDDEKQIELDEEDMRNTKRSREESSDSHGSYRNHTPINTRNNLIFNMDENMLEDICSVGGVDHLAENGPRYQQNHDVERETKAIIDNMEAQTGKLIVANQHEASANQTKGIRILGPIEGRLLVRFWKD
ncbi:hypothetical protein C5167_043585 [Papaver somniferum]|uniref:Uncharacterized protein n=2 Tax=Papaver somniferum TaxID=3469 RepID=A0A4Y7L7T8_PAPSO|nr:hypothetical protein C5167_043585 [Papaver somniferum]